MMNLEGWINRVHFGDCLETLRRMPDGIVNTCVTSPPYFGLRDYGHPVQIGLEETPEQFIAKLVEVFREVRRVLRDDGTCWVNMGDSYARSPAKGGSGPGGKNINYSDSYTAAAERRTAGAGVGQRGAQMKLRVGADGVKEKDLLGVPWMLAFALRSDGWYLRQDIIWAKPNPMPESVTDRCTKAHEYVFLLSKSPRYYYDHEAIKEPVALATVARMAQDIGQQQGSMRANGGGDARAFKAGGRSSSGNLERKPRPGAPEDHAGNAAGSVPWEGSDRNKRSVWTVATKPYAGAHFATYPEELIEPCVLAGAPAGGVVLDPFGGSGTTGSVAQRLGRKWIMCELNPAYGPLQDERLAGTLGLELM